MTLQRGVRVYWGTPEVIYLEGTITAVDEKTQTVNVRIDRATPHSAHLIGTQVPFAVDGVKVLEGMSPPGTTSVRSVERQAPPELSDDEKIQRAAVAAIHQRYGYTLPQEEERELTDQVTQSINNDPTLRQQIITSMNEILRREF